MRSRRLLAFLTAALVAVCFGASAWAQSVTQAGPSIGGHAPMYVLGPGQGFASVMDSGFASGLSAAGTQTGAGLSEILQVNHSPGSGVFGTHVTLLDNPLSTGSYHGLSFDANALGGGLLTYNAFGAAAPLPFNCSINGVFIADCLAKATGGNVSFTGSGATNIFPIFINDPGTQLGKSSLSQTSTQIVSAKPYQALLQTVVPIVNTTWGVTPSLITTTHGGNNGNVGAVVNDLPPATVAFPTGSSGYGLVNAGSAGNVAFGMYGEADLDDHGTAVGAEIDCMNYKGAPDTGLPPNRGIGTTTNACVGLQVGAGGLFDGATGIIIAGALGGVLGPPDTLHRWNTGIYMGGGIVPGTGGAKNYGIFIDADATGPMTGEVIQNYGTGINLQLDTTGPMVPDNTVLAILDATASPKFTVRQNGDVYNTGKLEFNQPARPTVTACGSGPNVNRSNDQAGVITVGSGTVTSCQVSFAVNFRQIPACVVSSLQFMPALVITGLNFDRLVVGPADGSSNMASVGFTYHCFDQP